MHWFRPVMSDRLRIVVGVGIIEGGTATSGEYFVGTGLSSHLSVILIPLLRNLSSKCFVHIPVLLVMVKSYLRLQKRTHAGNKDSFFLFGNLRTVPGCEITDVPLIRFL